MFDSKILTLGTKYVPPKSPVYRISKPLLSIFKDHLLELSLNWTGHKPCMCRMNPLFLPVSALFISQENLLKNNHPMVDSIWHGQPPIFHGFPIFRCLNSPLLHRQIWANPQLFGANSKIGSQGVELTPNVLNITSKSHHLLLFNVLKWSFPYMGVPNSWMVWFRENPDL